MIGCRPCSTPYLKDKKALYDIVEPISDPSIYRRLIGKLLYLCNIRPNIYFSIHLLSWFMQAPIVNHYAVIQHVLRSKDSN